jgi:hypothetical protein
MPVEVIKYTCEFRCGAKAVGGKSRMASHESKCWKNPDNKTCKTCSNEIYDWERDEGDINAWRGCKIKNINDVLEGVEEILKNQQSVHLRPIYKCPYWNKADDENSKKFAETLEIEIRSEEEGTEHYPFFNKPQKKESLPF